MTIIRTLAIGEKIWLGATLYEVVAQARDEKNRLVADVFDLKPVDWADWIKELQEPLRRQVQKTNTIRTKLPIRVLVGSVASVQ